MFVRVYACSEYRYVGWKVGVGGGEGSNQLCSSINSVYKAPEYLVSYTKCFVIIVSLFLNINPLSPFYRGCASIADIVYSPYFMGVSNCFPPFWRSMFNARFATSIS